jgi:chloramphenicol O-acetyltransferase type A
MREIDPKTTSRAKAFDLWMKAAMPMVTMTKTFDITHLRRLAKRKGVKLNMLMCYAIVSAASKFKEFYMLPVGDKLMEFDYLAINTIVRTTNGGINTCDIPYSEDIHTFAADYLRITEEAKNGA